MGGAARRCDADRESAASTAEQACRSRPRPRICVSTRKESRGLRAGFAALLSLSSRETGGNSERDGTAATEAAGARGRARRPQAEAGKHALGRSSGRRGASPAGRRHPPVGHALEDPQRRASRRSANPARPLRPRRLARARPRVSAGCSRGKRPPGRGRDGGPNACCPSISHRAASFPTTASP